MENVWLIAELTSTPLSCSCLIWLSFWMRKSETAYGGWNIVFAVIVDPSVRFDRGTAGHQAYESFLSDVLRHCKPEGGGEALLITSQTSLIGILVGPRLMVRVGWGSLGCNGMRFARYDNHLWKYHDFTVYGIT